MFQGRYLQTMDEKGRVMIPAKFREVLKSRYDERLVLTNYDGCLLAFPFEEWRQLQERINQKSWFIKEVRQFSRFFVSSAVECPLDRQGRVLIPQALRDFAELDREVVLAGMNNRIEIWRKEKWEQEFRLSVENLDQIVQVIAELGL